MLIWRGIGIAVPIIFFISAWITSYWFDGTPLSLSNYPYVGWAMLWAGIVVLLLGGMMALAAAGDDAEGTGEPMGKHDFFWLPIWLWGIILLGLSIWLINKTPTYYGYKPDGESTEIIPPVQDDSEALSGSMTLNLYNPTADTASVLVQEAGTNKLKMESVIPPSHIRYSSLRASKCKVTHGDNVRRFTLYGAELEGPHTYNEAWYVIGEQVDLVMINVTEACRSDINKEELAAIDWMQKFVRRDKGNTLIAPALSLKDSSQICTVYKPGISLPLEKKDNEVIYAWIPIPSERELTDAYLDSMVIDVAY